MMHYQQQIQKIMRSLLPVRKSALTSSECELLAHLYLKPEQNTPILLSQNSGMKKEAVSRCLKSLLGVTFGLVFAAVFHRLAAGHFLSESEAQS